MLAGLTDTLVLLRTMCPMLSIVFKCENGAATGNWFWVSGTVECSILHVRTIVWYRHTRDMNMQSCFAIAKENKNSKFTPVVVARNVFQSTLHLAMPGPPLLPARPITT